MFLCSLVNGSQEFGVNQELNVANIEYRDLIICQCEKSIIEMVVHTKHRFLPLEG